MRVLEFGPVSRWAQLNVKPKKPAPLAARGVQVFWVLHLIAPRLIAPSYLPVSISIVCALTLIVFTGSTSRGLTAAQPEAVKQSDGSTVPPTGLRPSYDLPASAQVDAPRVDQTYTLGPGDVILISFLNVPEYSGQQIVLVDGSLNLPVFGRLSVSGMTLVEAEDAIATQYSRELRYPQVRVTLLRARPLQVGIVGEINKPGFYTLSLVQDAQFPTLAQLIQLAGGATQAADLRLIEIRRPRRMGPPQRIAINLWEFLRNGDLNQNIALRDGDTILIPATTTIDLAETAQLAASNLTANTDQIMDVVLVGEVSRPGAYKLQVQRSANDRPTLTRAIQTAGGITSSANLREIQVRRLTRTSGEQLININLWQLLQSGDQSQDLVLQQGDTIVIPTATTLTPEETVQLASTNLSPEVIRVNVVGQVERPGAVEVPPDTTLNQAILAAGGLTRRANRSVKLIRLNPNGSITREEIRVDFSASVNRDTNPILSSGDTIVVGRSGFASVVDLLGDTGGFFNSILRLIDIFN